MGELERRLVHASGAGLPGLHLLYRAHGVGLDYPGLRRLLLVGSGVVLGLELLRLSGRVDWAVYDRLTREYERDNLAGYALYMFGMAAVALAFPWYVGVPAMLMLAIGDPISGLLGSDGLVKQAWVLFVMFGVCVFIAAWFVPPPAAVAGAVVATLADGVKPVVRTYVIDDNITIPIGAAVAMTVALRLPL